MATASDVPNVSHADVLRVIARDFPVAMTASVIQALRQYKNVMHPDATDDENARVHLAILKIASGQFNRIGPLVSEAYQDFRDVLGPAEYPEFSKIGFVGVDRLTEAEKAQLIQRDWDQYHDWLRPL
jgi:hypothetical protein